MLLPLMRKPENCDTAFAGYRKEALTINCLFKYFLVLLLYEYLAWYLLWSVLGIRFVWISLYLVLALSVGVFISLDMGV